MKQMSLFGEPQGSPRPEKPKPKRKIDPKWARTPCTKCGEPFLKIIEHTGQGSNVHQTRECPKCGALSEL